jgi:membrane fusion protein, multidrug efflux system
MMFRLPPLLAAVAISTLAGSALAGPPSVAVQTQPPRQGSVPDVLTVYGTAQPALDGGMTLSFQQEGRVVAIAVTAGETVHAGERLLDFGASPAAIAAYEQAVSALSAARQKRAHTAQLLAQQLATRDQLSQTDKTAADAQATLDALRREGADQGARTLTAPFDGIISTIPVAQGDRVQPGATLMTITRLDGLVVTVGIEPKARGRIHAGEPVHLTALTGSQTLEGKILRLDGVLNPKTRLLDADIAVPAGSVVSGAAYQADITTTELSGWIVPHDAILSDDKGTYLYQVAGTKPSRVPVAVVGSAGSDDVVHGSLDPQLPVVVQGNYQITGDTVLRVSSTQ